MTPYVVAMLGLAFAFVANLFFALSGPDPECARRDDWPAVYAHVVVAGVAAIAMLVVYVAARL